MVQQEGMESAAASQRESVLASRAERLETALQVPHQGRVGVGAAEEVGALLQEPIPVGVALEGAGAHTELACCLRGRYPVRVERVWILGHV